jgi:hypothetical protein
MIIRFIKQISAPTLFSKGLVQYQKGNYGIAKPLLVKAAEWMPGLDTNPLHQAVLLLCDHHLTQGGSATQFQSLLDALKASPHKETDDYRLVALHIKQVIDSL